MTVVSLLSLGAVAGAWVLFVYNLLKSFPDTLAYLCRKGFTIKYTGFSRTWHFRTNYQDLTYCFASPLVTQSTSERKRRFLRSLNIIFSIFGVIFSLVSTLILIYTIYSIFNQKSSSYTFAVPRVNVLWTVLALFVATLFHELGHVLFMFFTKTPIIGIEMGVYFFMPFISIISITVPAEMANPRNTQTGAINAVGGIVGNILSVLLVMALAYAVAHHAKNTLSAVTTPSSLVYIGEGSRGIEPYSFVFSMANHSLATGIDLNHALTVLDEQHFADYANIQLLIDEKSRISLTTGVMGTVGAHSSYNVHQSPIEPASFWPSHTSTQITGGIQLPYAALKDIEPLQCHAPQSGALIYLAHYHTVSAAQVLVLSPHVISSIPLIKYLTDEQSQLCHYSTADYICMYPYITTSSSVNNSSVGVYVWSNINGVHQMVPLPISRRTQTLLADDWKNQYKKQFTAIPKSLAHNRESLEAAVRQIKRSNQFTSIVQLFTEASTGMAMLASLGFPRTSDGQRLLSSTIHNKTALGLIQSAFWASSVTLFGVLTLSIMYSSL